VGRAGVEFWAGPGDLPGGGKKMRRKGRGPGGPGLWADVARGPCTHARDALGVSLAMQTLVRRTEIEGGRSKAYRRSSGSGRRRLGGAVALLGGTGESSRRLLRVQQLRPRASASQHLPARRRRRRLRRTWRATEGVVRARGGRRRVERERERQGRRGRRPLLPSP
jgi:hypothetical protein